MANTCAFICDDCGKDFKVKKSLLRHSIVHKERVQLTCFLCNSKYFRKDNLIRHIKNCQKPIQTFKCESCSKVFSKKLDLKRHVQNHLKFVCETCGKEFQKKYLLSRHQNWKHCRSFEKRCPLCNFKGHLHNMLSHFLKDHHIVVKCCELTFSNLNEFYVWKNKIETELNCKFVRNQTEGKKYIKFVCHRSGYFKSKGKGLRSLKRFGSNKINGYCPAKMSLKLNGDGTTSVNFVETHVGHDFDPKRFKESFWKPEDPVLGIRKTGKQCTGDVRERKYNPVTLRKSLPSPKYEWNSTTRSLTPTSAKSMFKKSSDNITGFGFVETSVGHLDLEEGRLNVYSELKREAHEVIRDGAERKNLNKEAIPGLMKINKLSLHGKISRHSIEAVVVDSVTSCPPGIALKNNDKNFNVIETCAGDCFNPEITSSERLNITTEINDTPKLVIVEEEMEGSQDCGVVEHYQEENESSYLEAKKLNLSNEVVSALELIKSKQQLEAIKKITDRILPTIKAMQDSEAS